MLTLIVVLGIAAVAYFHYVQGFFSATISAMLAIVAAVVAFGFHEWIVVNFAGTYMPDLASSIVLVAMFGIIYIVLRVLFDSYVPGNLTFPLMIDRIGGALAGIVAGIFAMGIFVIAAEALPFGPTVGGYSRFTVSGEQKDVSFRGANGATVNEELEPDATTSGDFLRDSDEKHLLIPVDDIVVNVTSHLSEGALAGPDSVASVHPAFLNELFFQRIGIQTGAKHVALNTPNGKQTDVIVQGVYSPLPTTVIPQADAEVAGIKDRPTDFKAQVLPNDASKTLLIVRTKLDGSADKDSRVRLSPVSVRLNIKGKNYFPIGTIDMVTSAFELRRNRPDDFIVVGGGGTADFVFQIPDDDQQLVLADQKNKNKNGPLQLAAGSFLEVKRFGIVDLSGKTVNREIPPPLAAKAPTVERKRDLTNSPKAEPPVPVAPTPTPGSTASPAATESPFEYQSKKISADLPTGINVEPHDGNSGPVKFASGSGTLKDGKFVSLTLQPADAAQLDKGENKISQLSAPDGMQVVQILGTPSTKDGANPWEWADKIGEFELVDNGGNAYKAHGVWATVKLTANLEDRVIARYEAESEAPKLEHPESRPTEVRLIFLIPEAAQPQTLKLSGKPVTAVN